MKIPLGGSSHQQLSWSVRIRGHLLYCLVHVINVCIYKSTLKFSAKTRTTKQDKLRSGVKHQQHPICPVDAEARTFSSGFWFAAAGREFWKVPKGNHCCIFVLIRGGFALQILMKNYMNIAIKQVNRDCDMGLWEMLFQKTSTIAQWVHSI